MERLNNWTAAPIGGVQKLRPEQIATRSTWGRVPDVDMTKAAMRVVHVVPAGATTITAVNELDPGTLGESVGDDSRLWFDRPASYGYVTTAGGKALS